MHDTELYRHLLGLNEPSSVERVELSADQGRVDVWVAHPAGTRFRCPQPQCDRELGCQFQKSTARMSEVVCTPLYGPSARA